jgi:carbon storage regulator
MIVLTRQVDQWIVIGSDIRVSPTDIDAQGVRLVARGRVMGGPDDGAAFHSVHELTVGQSCHLGPHVAITLVKVDNGVVRLGVLAPAHIAVHRKEAHDQLQDGGQGNHEK